ncbi:M15 family metallopeptidase [Actinocorallia populi]|uniref:M15 family metallopeptidase n=1 Tax=Actinocorallia populi TaxID=2079200 RepID=UPI000D08D197|nr:M15 family metallopeptidase [Actinocorallia populi]
MRSRLLLPLIGAASALVLSGCGRPPAPDVRPGSAAPGSATAPAPRGDGRIADDRGLSPFETDHVALTELDPRLLRAVRQAAARAKTDGVDLFITSGWRSADYQRRLFDQAVTQYGSREEAKRYVLPPEKSAHVRGEAVDIGPTDAADWLGRRGAAFGLCQVYANEMWHFELATRPGGACPPQLPDATAAEY